jgi:hypothetical protein
MPVFVFTSIIQPELYLGSFVYVTATVTGREKNTVVLEIGYSPGVH